MPNSSSSKRAYVSLACENCRIKHRRCDGNKQCNNCLKADTDCVYLAHRKRGPSQGNKETLHKKVLELESRLEALKTQICNDQPTNVDLVTIHCQEDAISDLPMQVFSVGDEYFQQYRTFMSFHNVDDSRLDYNTLYQPNSTMYSNAFIYSMMANAAMRIGDINHANEFHNNAMTIVRDTYSTPHSHLGATHLLLSEWFARNGDHCKSVMYRGLALQTCNNVLSHDNSDPIALATYTTFLIHEIGLNNNNNAMNELTQIIEKKKNIHWSNREFAKWVSGSALIWNEFDSESNNVLEQSSLEELLLFVDRFFMNIPNRIPESVRNVFEASLFAFKSLAYRIHKRPDMALYYSLQATQSIDSISNMITFASGIAIFPLSLTSQIFKSLGRMDLFEKNIQLIRTMDNFFPLKYIEEYLRGARIEPSPYHFINENICSPRFQALLQKAQDSDDNPNGILIKSVPDH